MKFIAPVFLLLLSQISLAQNGTVKWRITFTYSQTLNSSSHSASGESSHSFSMNGSVSMLVAGQPSFDHGHVIIMTPQDSLLSFSVEGSVTERMESISRSSLGIMETRTDEYEGKPDLSEQGVEFEYDPSPEGAKYINAGIRFNRTGRYEINQYHRGAGEPDRHNTYNVDNKDEYGTYVAGIGSSTDSISVVKNGFIIDGGKTENSNSPGQSGESSTSSNIIRYHVTIMKESDIDALIVPLVDEQYKKWMPAGPVFTGSDEQGNSIQLKIVLINKRFPLKPVNASFTASWNLKSSSEPGYCMNFPDEKKADKKKDLRFDQSAAAIKDFQSVTESKAVSKKGKGEAPVNIISYDYGSFGNVTATVTLDDGSELQAISKFDNKPVFNVPMDDNNNHIADEWEKQQGVLAKNYSAAWDEDYLPQGLGDHNGDGLTLYEEYRGFCENKKHIRTSATTKDLMICDMIGDRSKDGIAMFKGVAKINVHDDFQLDEFGRESKDMELEGLPKDKCINFNYSKESHSVDQHGIAIVKSLERKGYAQAVTKKPDMPIGTPKNYKYLEITVDFDPGPAGYNVVNGTLGADGSVSMSPGQKAKIISDNYASTVAHEMFHCCNVQHHGATDHRKVTLYVCKDSKKLASDPNFNPDPNAFCLLDPDENIIKEITLFDAETQQALKPGPNYPANGLELYLGMQHGEHSGMEDCIMRYNAASMYKDAAGNYMLLKANNGMSYEMTGIQLCTSPAGTGINAPSHKPQPRYGDAAAGRGNCMHQFCINDKYH